MLRNFILFFKKSATESTSNSSISLSVNQRNSPVGNGADIAAPCKLFKSRCWMKEFSLERGWSGGAMVLRKLPVPGRPTNLDHRRARAYCACSRCGWGIVWTFLFSSVLSLLFLPLFGRRPDID